MNFCILVENCSVFDRRTQTSGLSYRNPLCEGCRNRSRRELNLLRYDFVDLSQLIVGRQSLSEVEIARPKPGSRPPIDMQVFTLRSAIAEVVMTAEVELRRNLGMLHSSAPVRDGYGLSAAVGFLHSRVDDLARLPPTGALWGSQGAAEGVEVRELTGVEVLVLLGGLHRQARRMCGVDPRTVRLPGLCPSCSVPALTRTDDNVDYIWCAHCQARLTQAGYYAAQQMRFAVTPASEAR